MSEKIEIQITGERTMNCMGCENGVKMGLSSVPGVITVSPDRETQKVLVQVEDSGPSAEALITNMEDLGYEASVV